MANEINYISRNDREELYELMASQIANDIRSSIMFNGSCNVLLSGGSTPRPVYEKVACSLISMEKISWGLIDERYVDSESEFSNESMIRKALGEKANIIGLISNIGDRQLNVKIAEEKYESFLLNTDISILGMGPDGHTASIFPGDEASEELRRSGYIGIQNTNAPSFPTERITCSPAMICNSRKIYLLFTGEEKLKVLNDLSRKLPIHDILTKRPDITIYYAD